MRNLDDLASHRLVFICRSSYRVTIIIDYNVYYHVMITYGYPFPNQALAKAWLVLSLVLLREQPLQILSLPSFYLKDPRRTVAATYFHQEDIRFLRVSTNVKTCLPT